MRRELTKKFLEEILRKYEKDDSIVVRNFEVANAVDVGENFLSDVKKVAVCGYKVFGQIETDYEIHLIVKLFLENPEIVKRFPLKEAFINEMNAYNILIPELKKYTSDGSLPVPECVYADEGITVLKNLSVEGYAIIDKRKRFSLNQIESILKVLAKLHSASMVMSCKDPNGFNQLSKMVKEILWASAGEGIQLYQEMGIDIATRVFEELPATPENQTVIKTLLDLKKTALSKTISLFKEIRPRRVLNHGDSWSNNILIKGDRVVLIDLQVMRCTSVAADLCYFLHVNVTPKVRRENYTRFLNVYLEAMNAHLRQSGCGIQELTMDWLLGEIHDFSVYGFLSELTFLPLFHYNRDDLNMNDKSSEEIESFEYNWNLLTPEYKISLREIVVDYVQTIKLNCYGLESK